MAGVPVKLKWATPACARDRPPTEHSQSGKSISGSGPPVKRGDSDVNKSPRTIATPEAMKSSFKAVAENEMPPRSHSRRQPSSLACNGSICAASIS